MSYNNKNHEKGEKITKNLDKLTKCEYNININHSRLVKGVSWINHLSYYRNKKRLTQKELSKKVNISASSIAMYETGERRPSLKKAKSIADFFEVSIEDIFFDYCAHKRKA